MRADKKEIGREIDMVLDEDHKEAMNAKSSLESYRERKPSGGIIEHMCVNSRESTSLARAWIDS